MRDKMPDQPFESVRVWDVSEDELPTPEQRKRLRRGTLLLARLFPPGAERNQLRSIVRSLASFEEGQRAVQSATKAHRCARVEKSMTAISIGLVDDHPLLIEGIVSLMSRVQHLEVLATGSTAGDIIILPRVSIPDVIIVDMSMPGDVYAAIASSIKFSQNTKIVAFTTASGVNFAISALDVGANGYVLKGSSAQELIQAVEAVCRVRRTLRKALQAK